MVGRVARLKTLKDIGGLKLVCLKVLDRLMHEDKAGERLYNICESAETGEYPDLLEKLFKYYGGGTGNLQLDHPRLFTEKIQWMKLYDSTYEKTRLADKYLVREWIKETIGERYLVPLLGVWDRFEDIEFDKLPENYVLKCNHGSGMNLVVKNNLDKEKAKESFDKWMNINYAFCAGLEMHYADMPRKIIAEKYIEEMDGSLYDYKIHCFGGEPKFIQCIGDRDLKKHTGYQMNYDTEWHELDWTFEDYPRFPYEVEKPVCLEEMLDVAKKLSAGFSYVRVDLYEIKGKVLFGEMTFTPASGNYRYRGSFTRDVDMRLGEMIELNNEGYNS